MNRSNRFLRAFSKRTGIWASAVVLSLSGAPVWAGYTYTDLREQGGMGTFGMSINNAGQVVGGYFDGGGEHATIWNGPIATNLAGMSGFALDINNSGQIAGYYFTPGGHHAVVWDGATMRDLGNLGGLYSAGSAINDAGQVAGWSDLSNSTTHATLWNGATTTDLGTLGGQIAGRMESIILGPLSGVLGLPAMLQSEPPFGMAQARLLSVLWGASIAMRLISIMPGGLSVLQIEWMAVSMQRFGMAGL